MFAVRIMRVSPDAHPAATNKTKAIGGQWKTLKPHTRDLFAIRSKDELEVYHMSKSLWTALERIMQPLNPIEDRVKAESQQAQALPKMSSGMLALTDEVQLQLCLFLL